VALIYFTLRSFAPASLDSGIDPWCRIVVARYDSVLRAVLKDVPAFAGIYDSALFSSMMNSWRCETTSGIGACLS